VRPSSLRESSSAPAASKGSIVHLEVPRDVRVENPRSSLALLRCAQELVTNSIKHASARSLARGDTWFHPALTASLRRGIEARGPERAGGPQETGVT